MYYSVHNININKCFVRVSGPLNGHLDVDILDSAFATIHIGIFGIDFDIFRGELCFKGGIEYGLNILKVRTITILYLHEYINNFVAVLIS